MNSHNYHMNLHLLVSVCHCILGFPSWSQLYLQRHLWLNPPQGLYSTHFPASTLNDFHVILKLARDHWWRSQGRRVFCRCCKRSDAQQPVTGWPVSRQWWLVWSARCTRELEQWHSSDGCTHQEAHGSVCRHTPILMLWTCGLTCIQTVTYTFCVCIIKIHWTGSRTKAMCCAGMSHVVRQHEHSSVAEPRSVSALWPFDLLTFRPDYESLWNFFWSKPYLSVF